MGAAAEAWARSGIPVRGLAVSAAAAGVLAAEAGIATDTVAKFLYEHDRPDGPSVHWRLRRGKVVVVDEAAMVASADLAKVVTLAERARAKVVLVGDHRQLGAVEAGGLFRLLATETNAAELTGVRRFHAEWERAASLRLRAGDRSVVEEYLSQGRVVGGERSVMVEEAFGRWWMARARGESVVVCAAEVAALEALREALAHSESLSTLAPRLANLGAWIARETPPDRSRELGWAADGLDHARRWCRPGQLTRAGREDRRRLEAAQARYDAVAAEQGQRQAWLEAHADTLAYRDELAEAIAKRRRELGVAAAVTQPDHIIDILGALPSTDARGAVGRWMAMARHIEAYREEWGVEPERLGERPRDLCQGRAWEDAVHAAQLLSEPPVPVLERGPERGFGLEL